MSELFVDGGENETYFLPCPKCEADIDVQVDVFFTLSIPEESQDDE